jgi:tetratricopeptide (TPR) repeat protein
MILKEELSFISLCDNNITAYILRSSCHHITLGNATLIENFENLDKVYMQIIEHYKKSDNLQIKNCNIGIIYYMAKKYDKMKKYFMKKPQNSGSINNLGFYYLKNEKNVNLAIGYLNHAAIRGNKMAIINLMGYYKPLNINLWIKCCLDGIKLRSEYAANELGYHYYTIKNYELAKKYYEIAIDLGSKFAANNLGFLYHHNEKNNILAKKYYETGVEHGDKFAGFNLGYYYQHTESNYDLMKKYYKISIGLDSGESAYKLGLYYQSHKIDFGRMKKYYKIGIKLKNSESAYNLGYYYQHTEINPVEMEKYYEIGTELKCGNSACNLGSYYRTIKKDDNLTKKYYEMGVNLKSSNSAYFLGYYYQHTEKNYDLMKKYYEIGIDLKNQSCAYELGKYYYNVEKNCDLAKKYNKIFVEIGPKNAYFQLSFEYRSDLSLSTFYFLHYILTEPAFVYSLIGLYITAEHRNLVLDIVAKKNMMLIDNIFKRIIYIDDDILIDMLKIIAPNTSDVIVTYINKELNCNIANSFPEYLSTENKNLVMKVNTLTSVDEECNICFKSSDSVIFQCHNNHFACKSCTLKLEMCPYCRQNLFKNLKN